MILRRVSVKTNKGNVKITITYDMMLDDFIIKKNPCTKVYISVL